MSTLIVVTTGRLNPVVTKVRSQFLVVRAIDVPGPGCLCWVGCETECWFGTKGVSSLSVIEIQGERLRLLVRPDLGAGIADLALRSADGQWHPVLRRTPAQTGQGGELSCFLMAPWCNRIAGAKFVFDGRECVLRPNRPEGTAIHGDVRHRPFTILDRSPVSVRMHCDLSKVEDRNWPWACRVSARYEIEGSALRCELEVTNLDEAAMPVGLGFHPYWMRRLWDERDAVRVRANLSGRYPLDQQIPIGPARPDPLCDVLRSGVEVGARSLDDLFTGSLDGAMLEWPASGVRAHVSCSPELSHSVLYVPTNRKEGALPWFCVEPMSIATDGFNLSSRGEEGTGVRVLQPMDSMRVHWTTQFEFAD